MLKYKGRLTTDNVIKRRLLSYFKTSQSNIFNSLLFLGKLSYQLSLTIFSVCLVNLPSSYGLATKTANGIHGYAPEIINTQLASDKHGFTLNGVFYSESTGNIKENEIKEFDGDLTFNDFSIKIFGYGSLDTQINYQDIDGDSIDPTHPFLEKDAYFQWYDANGKKIPEGDNNKIMGCGSGYAMPLKLEIGSKVQTFSQYGIPKESDFLLITKFYEISLKPKICYARPNATIITQNAQWHSFDVNGNSEKWNLDNAVISPEYGGGHSPDYILDLGFKANPNASNGRIFPTTGFPGAKFQLVMVGAQTDYKFNIKSFSKDVVDVDSQGFVILWKKPSGPITVQVVNKKNELMQFNYTFTPTNVWAVPTGDYNGGWLEASTTKCGGTEKVLSRKELTNSPKNSAPMQWKYHDNNYTRSIDFSLGAEWGPMNENTYPESAWRSKHYWTRDNYTNDRQFVVHSVNGGVGYDGYENIGSINYIACKN